MMQPVCVLGPYLVTLHEVVEFHRIPSDENYINGKVSCT